jgi:hypothetical protein
LLDLQDLDSINHIVNINDRACVVPPTEDFLKTIDNFPWQQLELYFFLDQILIDRIGQQLSFNEIMSDISQHYPELYMLIFKKTKDIINVLP